LTHLAQGPATICLRAVDPQPRALCGFLAIALRLPSPWLELVAAGFGVGAGLTLDEFALWLHLEDVYRAEQGRRSIDAVIVAAVVAGLILRPPHGRAAITS